MAKAMLPNQHDGTTEVKLDPRGSGSAEWCDRHAPPKPGLCWRHSVHFYELHDEEIREIFGVEAIFYCPELGCDELDWDNNHRIGGDVLKYRRWLITFSNSQITPELERIVAEVFRNAARLKIFFLKQRQLVEKLEKAGIFEGGKKT